MACLYGRSPIEVTLRWLLYRGGLLIQWNLYIVVTLETQPVGCYTEVICLYSGTCIEWSPLGHNHIIESQRNYPCLMGRNCSIPELLPGLEPLLSVVVVVVAVVVVVVAVAVVAAVRSVSVSVVCAGSVGYERRVSVKREYGLSGGITAAEIAYGVGVVVVVAVVVVVVVLERHGC